MSWHSDVISMIAMGFFWDLMIKKVFWSLNLVPTHWAPIFIRMCHNTPVCWFDWPLVCMLEGVTVQHFLTILFTEPQIRSTPPVSLVISHILWDAEIHLTLQRELTVRLVKDMSSITRTHSLLPNKKGSAELAVQSQQSHSMMAQAMKYPNVSETKHILIILIVPKKPSRENRENWSIYF